MGSLTGMRNINLALTSWWLSRRETWVLRTEQTSPTFACLGWRKGELMGSGEIF